MIQTIIFDFNRTLYNPDVDRLLPQAKQVLTTLKRRKIALHLISRKEAGREDRIERTGLAPYFDSVTICPSKTKKIFRQILGDTDPATALVIGDRLCDEIAIANKLGITSVRLRLGKFVAEEPASAIEIPTYTITSLPDLLPLTR